MTTQCDAHGDCTYEAVTKTPGGNHICDICVENPDAVAYCEMCNQPELHKSTGDVGCLDEKKWYCPECDQQRKLDAQFEADAQAIADYGAALDAVVAIAARTCYELPAGGPSTKLTCIKNARWWNATTGQPIKVERLCPVCRAVVMFGGSA